MATEEIPLKLRFSADTTQAERAIAKYDKAVEKSEKSAENLADAVDKQSTSLKKNEKAAIDNAKALDQRAKIIDKEVKELKNSEKPNLNKIKALQDEAKEAQKTSKALMQKVTASQKATTATKGQSDALKVVSINSKLANSATVGFTRSLGGLKTQLLGAVVAAVSLNAAFSAFDKSLNFQRTINTIKAVGEATDEEMRIAREAIEAYGASTVFTSQEVADAFKEMVKGGLTVNQTLAALPGVLDAAAASGDELQHSAEVVVGTLRSFNLAAKDSTRVADVLAQGDAKAATSISELGESIKFVGANAANSNQSLEDMVALLAFLSNRMIKAGDAGTDLNAILVRLQSPPKEAADALNTLGVKISDSEGKIRPLIDIIIDLQKAMKGLNQASQTKILSDIAGLNNLKSLSVLVNATEEDLRAMQDAMLNADGAAKKMADTILSGAVRSVEDLSAAVDAQTKAFGDGVVKGLEPFIKSLTDTIGRFQGTEVATEAVISVVANLIGVVVDGYKWTNEWFTLMTGGITIMDSFRAAIGSVLIVADGLAVTIRSVTKAILGLNEAAAGGGIDAFKARLDEIGKDYNALGDRATRLFRTFKPDKKTINTGGGDSGLGLPPAPSSGTGNYTGGGGGSKRKGRSAANKQSGLDRDAVRRSVDDLRDSLRDLQLDAREAEARLGPFVDQVDQLALKQQFAARETDVLNAGLDALRKTTVKTKEGAEAKREAIEDTTRALRENGIEIKNNANDQLKLADNLQRATETYERLRKEVIANQTAESVKNRISYELDALNEAFEAEQITAQQYYDERLALIERNSNIEKTTLVTRIGLIQEEINSLRDTNEDLERRRQLEIEILRLRGEITNLGQETGLEKEELNREQRQQEREAGNRIKQSVQQSLSQAISDTLTGDKTGNAIKKFASSIKNALIQAFSDALSRRIVQSFDGLFHKIGNYFNNLGGNTVTTQPSGAPSGQVINAAASIGGKLPTGGTRGGTGFFSKLFGGGKAVGTQGAAGGAGVAGASGLSLSNALGPAAAGGAAGFGIGSAAGGKLGGLGGAVAGYFGGALAGGAIGFAVGGPIGAAVGAGIGSIAGLIGGITGGGKKKKQKEAERKQAKFARFDAAVDSIFATTDTDNLQSLAAAKKRLSAAFRKDGGSRNAEVSKAAFARLNAAIRQREEKIEEFIKDIQVSNDGIRAEIAKFGKSEAEKFLIDTAQERKQIIRERDKLLEEYKDSQKAQTEIQAEYSLKRQLIAKQETEALGDSVKSVQDLLEERYNVVTANIFRRAETPEAAKAKQLSDLDAQLAETLKGIQAFQSAGTELPEGIKGLEDILKLATNATTQNVDLQVIIEGSTDEQSLKRMEAMLADFARKIGATAA